MWHTLEDWVGTNTNNENGFSYIELAITAAITLTLTAIALPPLTQAANKIETQIQTLKQYQETQTNNTLTQP
jgi:type II secretory pathway pseudopilin PulG